MCDVAHQAEPQLGRRVYACNESDTCWGTCDDEARAYGCNAGNWYEAVISQPHVERGAGQTITSMIVSFRQMVRYNP